LFDRQPAIAWAILTISASGAVAARRFRDHGVLDPLGIFSFAFAAYNGVLLLRLASMQDPTATVYPWPFTQDAYAAAGVLDAMAALTIFITAHFLERLYPTNKLSRPITVRDPGRSATAWLNAGIAVYAIGISMYFLQYQQIGGYLAGLKSGRGNRFEAFHEAALSWPYLAFVLPGLAAMWYAAEQSPTKVKKWVARSALLLWCGLLLPQGERLLVIQAILAVMAVTFVIRGRKLRVGLGLCFLLLLAYCGAAFFGYARVLIAPRVSGEITNTDMEYFLDNQAIFDQIKPEHTELAAPYLSLLQIVTGSEGDILLGNSYAIAVMSVIPKALYPGTKPIYLSERFANTIHAGKGPVSGWGFNPVAEAYLNFGVFGVIPTFMLWTIGFYVLGTWKMYPPIGVLAFAVLLPEAIDANRIDFRNVFCIIVYFTAGVGITFIVSKVFHPREIGTQSRRIRPSVPFGARRLV
jgi:hypothetical protein